MTEKEQIRRRFAALLGERKLAEKLAYICDVQRSIFFVWMERGFPGYAIAILELLEAMPRDMWPERITVAVNQEKVKRKSVVHHEDA
jgi:hypothetical protein